MDVSHLYQLLATRPSLLCPYVLLVGGDGDRLEPSFFASVLLPGPPSDLTDNNFIGVAATEAPPLGLLACPADWAWPWTCAWVEAWLNGPDRSRGGGICADIPGINGGGWVPDRPSAKAAAAAGRSAGRAASRSFSISASFSRFSFARRFWNQIFTWVSVRLSDEENSARSAIDRYCLARNFRSSDNNCWVVNGVRGFRLFLCFRKAHFIACGGIFGSSPFSETTSKDRDIYIFID